MVVRNVRHRVVTRVVCATGSLVTLSTVVAVVGAGRKW